MANKLEPKGTVLLTGASGFIGTWLLARLLRDGYAVRASVLDPEDKEEMEPIHALPASLTCERLTICKANLLVEGDFDALAFGCDGVFHLACPTNFHVEDPQRDAIDPAVQGSLNVLKSCVRSPSIKRVVFASSAAAIRNIAMEVEGHVYDECSWADVEYLQKNNVYGWPYLVAKTLAEKAAIKFATQHNLDLVIINLTLVTGPFLILRIPNFIKDFLALITGEHFRLPFLKHLSYVHIEDVVRAFIFLYETPSAKGRYICSAVNPSIGEIAQIISSWHPEFNILTDLTYLGKSMVRYFDSSKLKNLGFQYQYTSLEPMLEDSIQCCKDKGLFSKDNNGQI